MVKLIVGLRNPGSRFEGTRHNVGAVAVREWVSRLDAAEWQVAPWREEADGLAEVLELRTEEMRLWVLLPLTFMNDSGRAVAAFCKYKNIMPEEVVIVHDELELALGEVKWKEGGSASGHNGVRSVQEQVGSQKMRRLRLGIGRPTAQVPIDAFVLQKFLPEEREAVRSMVEQAGNELMKGL